MKMKGIFKGIMKKSIIGTLTLATTLSFPSFVVSQQTTQDQKSGSLVEIVQTTQDSLQTKEQKQFKREDIPSLLYHKFVTNPTEVQDRFTVTFSDFEKQLQELYDTKYSLICLEDFINQDYSNIPAGRKPLLLTFDDAWGSQVSIENGKLSIDCALNVLKDFYTKHPDFSYNCTFFVSFDKVPFEQKEDVKQKFELILSEGLDLANHTEKHSNAEKVSPQKFEEDIREGYDKLVGIVGNDFTGAHVFGFPYSRLPSDMNLIDRYNENNPPIIIAFTAKKIYYPNSKYKDFLIPRIIATPENVHKLCIQGYKPRIGPDSYSH